MSAWYPEARRTDLLHEAQAGCLFGAEGNGVEHSGGYLNSTGRGMARQDAQPEKVWLGRDVDNLSN